MGNNQRTTPIKKDWRDILGQVYENMEEGKPLSAGLEEDNVQMDPPGQKKKEADPNEPVIDPLLGDITKLDKLKEISNHEVELEPGKIKFISEGDPILLSKSYVTNACSTTASETFGLRFGWLYRKYRTLENPAFLAMHSSDWALVRDYVTGRRNIKATKRPKNFNYIFNYLLDREAVIKESGFEPYRVPVLHKSIYYQLMLPPDLLNNSEFAVYKWQFVSEN